MHVRARVCASLCAQLDVREGGGGFLYTRRNQWASLAVLLAIWAWIADNLACGVAPDRAAYVSMRTRPYANGRFVSAGAAQPALRAPVPPPPRSGVAHRYAPLARKLSARARGEGEVGSESVWEGANALVPRALPGDSARPRPFCAGMAFVCHCLCQAVLGRREQSREHSA